MKWFIIILFIVGGYMFLLMASTNMVLNQTAQLQHSYSTVAEQADKIAAGASVTSH